MQEILPPAYCYSESSTYVADSKPFLYSLYRFRPLTSEFTM